MKALKTILVATYVTLVALLLLMLPKCEKDAGLPPTNDTPLEREGKVSHPPIKESFKADVVMCIDCTGSMDGIINTIKDNALSFYPDMRARCLSHGKEITSMRIRVIPFRDLSDATPYALSPFFNMPAAQGEFRSYVSSLVANGGGDDPEIGYDALGLAMDSNWLEGEDVRQVIILWTDASSHPLSSSVPGPETFTQMTSVWRNKMNNRAKRLILFAPNDATWTAIIDNWDKSIRHDVAAGAGLSEVDYEKIIKALSENI